MHSMILGSISFIIEKYEEICYCQCDQITKLTQLLTLVSPLAVKYNLKNMPPSWMYLDVFNAINQLLMTINRSR